VSAELFPLFLKLAGRRVVLVGGGRVAASRLRLLLGTGARVLVVAPDVHPEIAASGAEVARRPFAASDLDGAWLAVAAAVPPVNREVPVAAEARRIFVNTVDDPEQASAYAAGVLRRGGVTVAVSTGGRAPALAGLLREALDAVLPEDAAEWVAAAQDLRLRQRAEGVAFGERRPLLLRALNRLYEAPARSGP
jgi:uroporphyrin-III C-methyltransferase/precorrin-2 dehydrogenase/sirohydrochlorin ferrochelatase